jgi:hypothetical protein
MTNFNMPSVDERTLEVNGSIAILPEPLAPTYRDVITEPWCMEAESLFAVSLIEASMEADRLQTSLRTSPNGVYTFTKTRGERTSLHINGPLAGYMGGNSVHTLRRGANGMARDIWKGMPFDNETGLYTARPVHQKHLTSLLSLASDLGLPVDFDTAQFNAEEYYKHAQKHGYLFTMTPPPITSQAEALEFLAKRKR